MKKRVLFLCTHNSARSQMAEGLLREMGGDRFEVFSAGTEATRVQPLAIEAMREAGVDISRHTSKTLEAFRGGTFDFVVTVCDRANESCPVFPGQTQRIHWSFDDPTAAQGSEAEKLDAYRVVRDRIRERLAEWIVSPSSGSTIGRTRALLEEGFTVFVCRSEGDPRFAAPFRELAGSPTFANSIALVEISADREEDLVLAGEIGLAAAEPSAVLVVPPGQVSARFTGHVTAETVFSRILEASSACCSPGGGCCS